MTLFSKLLHYRIAGWGNPFAYIFFVLVFGVSFFGLQNLLDDFIAFVLSVIIAALAEYIFFKIIPQKQEEEEVNRKKQEQKARVEQLVKSTDDCMSCEKPLEGNIECPHCGYDMSEILAKSDLK